MLRGTDHSRSLACSVYELVFPNGKRYVGISVHPTRRFREHLAEARRGSDLPVHRAIRKYGAENVVQYILLVADRNYCQAAEVALIALSKGYNASTGGEHAPMLGMRHSDETRQRMSVSHAGTIQSADWIARRTGTQIGAVRSAESRARMSVGQKARIRTEEEIARMADLSKRRISTPEWKQKLRVAALARWERHRAQKTPEPVIPDL